ncbi:MAG TPA: alpha/beta hydrolase [Vicinamibacterales bacterium]
MKVFHFGSRALPLLGALHAPQRLRPPGAAVLLCNPFGDEAVRAHRIYRVLATQLEQQGYPTLRFDYRCTGDSMGESIDASIGGCLDDIVLAADELMAATGAPKIVAIGLRLGGTLAALASARNGLRFRHLVLWDPVVDGASYLRELDAMHQTVTGRQSSGRDREGTPVGAGLYSEALGTPISATLAADIAAIDLVAVQPQAEHLTVISTQETPAIARLRPMAASPTGRWIDLPSSSPWNSAAALNASIVPTDVVQAVVERVAHLSP